MNFGGNRIMSFLRSFVKEVFGKSADAKPPSKGRRRRDAGKGPSSGGLINPFAEEADEPEGEPDGGKTPASGGLINPFAEDAAPPEPADDTARAKQFFDEAEALYKKKQYAKAAAQYRSAYEIVKGDGRGMLAFNVAQSYRLAKNFPNAVVWYQRALDLGGQGVAQYREEIEGRLAEMQGEMKKHPVRGSDGKDLGEAQMLFEQAEIAYGDGDYAKAEPLYKQAYSRSNLAPLCFNIGQTCRLAGKYADAKYWYREFLRQVPRSPYKDEIEKHIEELKKKAPDLPKDGDAGAADDAKKK
jgi:tetratricopeptide (TPR) repeat protein